MQRSTLKKLGKRTVQVVLPVLILLIIVYGMKNNWNQLMAYKFQLQPGFIVLSFLGFILQELSYGLIWRSVLRRLGVQLGLRPCLRIYLASEFVRYLPGNVWHVLTRILWVGKYGVSRSVAFASMTIELITKLAAGAFVFALSLLFWQDYGNVAKLLHGTPIFAIVGLVTMLALLIVLHPRVLNGMMNAALRLLKRQPIVLTLRYRDILQITMAWCVSWLIAGIAFYFLLLSVLPSAPLILLPICIGIYAIVWDIGFVSFITPSGLGVREGAVIALFPLAFALPFGIAAIVAIASRILSTLAELLCVSIAYLSGGGQMRAVHLEQEALAASEQANERSGKQMDARDELQQPSDGDTAHVEVEGGVGRD